MKKLNVNSDINKLEHVNSSKLANDQVKLIMKKIKKSIYQKSKNNPEMEFLLKRL